MHSLVALVTLAAGLLLAQTPPAKPADTHRKYVVAPIDFSGQEASWLLGLKETIDGLTIADKRMIQSGQKIDLIEHRVDLIRVSVIAQSPVLRIRALVRVGPSQQTTALWLLANPQFLRIVSAVARAR